MVISKREILRYIEERLLEFDPEIDQDLQISKAAVDLRLGNIFVRFHEAKGYIPAIQMDSSIWGSKDLWTTIQSASTDVQPGELVLAPTSERLKLPGDLMGFVEGRSSYARIGLGVHMTAPKIDPGFTGPIILELTNLGTYPIRLRENESVSQLILFRVDPPLTREELAEEAGKATWQHQTGPISPRRPRKRKRSR